VIDCFTEDAGREDHRTGIDMTISYTKAAVGSLLLVGRSLPAFADPLDTESFHHGHMWGEGWGFMGAGFMLLFWVLTILAIFVAVGWLMSQNDHAKNGGESNGINTLRNRLARDEIEVEEFEIRKRALNQ
jgi:putative membrane protein